MRAESSRPPRASTKRRDGGRPCGRLTQGARNGLENRATRRVFVEEKAIKWVDILPTRNQKANIRTPSNLAFSNSLPTLVEHFLEQRAQRSTFVYVVPLFLRCTPQSGRLD